MHRPSRSANRRTPERLTGVRSLIDECWRLSHGDHCASTAVGVSHRVCEWSSTPVHLYRRRMRIRLHTWVCLVGQQRRIDQCYRMLRGNNCASTEVVESCTRATVYRRRFSYLARATTHVATHWRPLTARRRRFTTPTPFPSPWSSEPRIAPWDRFRRPTVVHRCPAGSLPRQRSRHLRYCSLLRGIALPPRVE